MTPRKPKSLPPERNPANCPPRPGSPKFRQAGLIAARHVERAAAAAGRMAQVNEAAGGNYLAEAVLTARLVNLLGYWAWPSATIAPGAVTRNEITLRQEDGSPPHWQVSLRAGAQPDLVL